MTSQFKASFHRYDPKSGESRISSPVFINAEDFGAAFSAAERTRYGMEQADPERRYVIFGVEHHGLRGEVCSGARLFETSEELSARVAEKV